MLFIFCFMLSIIVVTSLPTSLSSEPKIGDFSHLMLQFNIDSPKPNFFVKKYPHEKWCHYYYNWEENDIFTVRECSKGEIFDYHTHQCEDKESESAQCWSNRYGKTKVHDQIHSKWRKHFRCPFSTGKYPDIFDCEKFFVCEDGKAKHKHCPQYKQFDRIFRHCVGEEVALCADETDAEDVTHRCPKSSGNFGHPKDCSKYYHCRKGKAHLKKCKKGTLFHEKHHKCMKMDKVHCAHEYINIQSESAKIESKSPDNITPILDVYDEPKEILKDSLSKPNQNNIDIVLVTEYTGKADHETSEPSKPESTGKGVEIETTLSNQKDAHIVSVSDRTEKDDVKTLELLTPDSRGENVETETPTKIQKETNIMLASARTEKVDPQTLEHSTQDSSGKDVESETTAANQKDANIALVIASTEKVDFKPAEYSVEKSTVRNDETRSNTATEFKVSTEALKTSDSTDDEFVPTIAK